MLGVSAVPAVLLFVAIWPAPESPRWFLRMGRRDDARASMCKLRPSVDVDVRLASIEAALQAESHQAPWSEIFAPRWRKPLAVGLGLAIFQQITGINAIIYYADQIFAAAGFDTPAAQASATMWAVGGVNVLATFIAIGFIDRVGRRKLLLAGLIGMGLSLVAVGIAFGEVRVTPGGGGATAAGFVTLAGLVGFIGCFAFSLGPVVWTVINEIYPGRVRGRAVALATAVNWAAAFVVSEFFLSLVAAIGEARTFWLFAFFCLVGWFWVYWQVPETQGRSLEQIEQSWHAAAPDAGGARRP